MRPSVLRFLTAALALAVLGATTPGRSAPETGRVPLTLVAPEPRLSPSADGAVVPTIDGFGLASRPGVPALPFRSLMVAIPDGAEPRLVVLSAAARDLPGIDIAPVPAEHVRDHDELARALLEDGAARVSDPAGGRTERRSTAAGPAREKEFRRDAAVYGVDGDFPDAPVRLGQVGWMRDQRFVEVIWTPVVYNPVGRVARFYSDIEAEVQFDLPAGASGGGGALAAAAPARDPHFEAAYAAALYNYEQGRQYRTRRGGAAGSASGTTAGLTSDAVVAGSVTSNSGAGPRYKMSVTREGIYRLGYTWLSTNAPQILTVDPRTLGITVDGAEIPIAIRDASGNDGEADGVFDTGDVIEFHGGPKIEDPVIPNWDFKNALIPNIYEANDFTDTQVYFLGSAGAAGSHLRIPAADGSPVSGFAQATDFAGTTRWDENNFFYPFGAGDPYVSIPSLLAGGTAAQRDISLSLPGLAGGAAMASIAVRIRGGSSIDASNPDHRTKIWANADLVNVKDVTWDGEVDHDETLTLPQSSLSDPGTVHLQAPGIAGVTVDRQYPDTIVVTYRRLFTAVGDGLLFQFPNQDARFQVGGLSTTPVVLEISRLLGNGEPDAIRITGATAGAPSSWIFEVPHDASPGAPAVRTFIVAGPGAWLVPAAIEPAQPATLKVAGQAADMLVIAARSVVDAAPGGALDNLLAHRLAAQGLSSKVVFIDQVYDEFSGGRRDANAIRSFLSWAYQNWRGPGGTAAPPAYVLLVGDATLDYKNNLAGLNIGTWIDQVPTPIMLQYSNIIGYYSSDNWLASFNGPDQIPDIHLGRITTRDPVASAAVFDKIRLFETTPPAGSWRGKGLLTAGDSHVTGEDVQFQGLNENVRQDYFTKAPFSTPVPPLYFPPEPYTAQMYPDFNATLKTQINAGAAVLTYVGHGAFDVWGYNDTFFNTTDAGGLTNGLKLPFMVNVNCLSGGFHYLKDVGSVAEGIVNNPNGGAVAAFAPSGLSNVFVGSVIFDELFRELLGPPRDRTLGPATMPVRIALWGQGSIVDAQSFTFLGDPASLLTTPAPEPPSGLAAVAGNGQVTLSWTPPVVPAAATRFYRADDPAGPYAVIACTPGGPSTCVDSTVINATRYYYYAVSVDSDQFEGRWSNFNDDCDAGPGCVTALPTNPNPPAAPTGLLVSDPGSGARLDVSWNASPEKDVKRYTVRWGISSGSYSSSVNVNPPAVTVALQGLTNGVRYYATVTATNTANLESAPAPEQSGVPHLFQGIAPPRAISDLMLNRSGSDLVLTWSRPLVDIYGRPTTVVGYRVYRGPTPGYVVTGAAPLAVINDGAVTTYTHAGAFVAAGDGYYVVTAFDASGLTSGAGRDLPNGFANLDVSFTAPSTVHLSWPAITTDVQGLPTIVDHYQIHVTSTPVGRASLGPSTLFLDNVTTTSVDISLPTSPRFISVLTVDNRGNLSPF